MLSRSIIILVLGVWWFGLGRVSGQMTNRVQVTPTLRFGLVNPQAPNDIYRNLHFNSADRICYMVTTTTNGRYAVFARLPREQTFIFALRDTNGRPVPKSKLGLQNSKPVDTKESASDLKIKHAPIVVGKGYFNSVFVPDDYFMITNAGVYTLELQMRCWTWKTNGQYGVVISPPIRVEIKKRLQEE